MSALTMLFLSILVFAVFLCSAAVTSFVAALTYPTVKQSLTFIRSGERSASLYIGFAIYGGIFTGCVLTLAFVAVIMALNISSAEDAALYAATLLSAGLGYWVGR
ncbi:hypothetical protein D7U93_12695 [Stenotrophomonas maltophilia]|uniref:hypothetical protein n=1 Tax=Stenotrophomonas TaxID=40323 RepID=UPI0013100A94|nr:MULTISPECIES: hypothetical protein [Stenotrophomonas]MBA0379115.1 hypothetical protein [Stenotrophomonas maltophilia]MBA0408915.1 hypothetical protein [Stenotrophomonas maltophilia]MBA0425239.1 hypothetical protein [Stenotrophomonas maltophilia]MBH1719216.1 hypothetical protein [Stenotrophomonas maltophilia]MBH1792749.1 hypothetical protein [Stenotrophomonas maltophilia]